METKQIVEEIIANGDVCGVAITGAAAALARLVPRSETSEGAQIAFVRYQASVHRLIDRCSGCRKCHRDG